MSKDKNKGKTCNRMKTKKRGKKEKSLIPCRHTILRTMWQAKCKNETKCTAQHRHRKQIKRKNRHTRWEENKTMKETNLTCVIYKFRFFFLFFYSFMISHFLTSYHRHPVVQFHVRMNSHSYRHISHSWKKSQKVIKANEQRYHEVKSVFYFELFSFNSFFRL